MNRSQNRFPLSFLRSPRAFALALALGAGFVGTNWGNSVDANDLNGGIGSARQGGSTPAPKYRAQDASPTPSSDVSSDFPTLDADFPTVDASLIDESSTPPAESELPDFMTSGGANVAEPTQNLPKDATSNGEPARQSLSEREETEKKLEQSYADWVEKRKSNQKVDDKTPRYLRPLTNDRDVFEDPSSPFAREERESGFIRQVTAADLTLMSDSETRDSKRELYDWEKEQPTPIDWSKYAITLDRIRAWFGMGPDERAALEYMRQACDKQNEYYKTKEPKLLKEAATLYQRAAERWPGPALKPNKDFSKEKGGQYGTLIEEDGLFFAGECWFFYRDFNRALVCFKALVSTYQSSIYKDVAMKRLYHIGCYWTECSEAATAPSVNVSEKDKPRFSTFAGAKKAFETIFLNDASDSGLAPAALFALANAYMRRGVNQGDGAFDSAARYYKQLYEYYPGSKYAEDAARLAMIALHKSYQGPMYDVAPLDEARKIAETVQRSGRGNQDVVLEELDKIKEEQARHLFVAGQYYEKRGNYASARSYYNRVVKEHPNSDFAVEAARLYETIASKPAEADQLAWIRPVAPFLPKSNNRYFEEEPDANLSKIARRDEALDQIGATGRASVDGDSNAKAARYERENVADASSATDGSSKTTRRY